jgi:hypothetical protein
MYDQIVRFSWVHPDVAERIRATLRDGRGSWEEIFGGGADAVIAPAGPPDGVEIAGEVWPRMAEHVARAERVREVVAGRGRDAAALRFGGSPHAVERAALMEALDLYDVPSITGLLACAIDEWVAYGHFLSRLVELGAAADPVGTVDVFERFVSAASAVRTEQPSWPERLRVARDGLAALYVRVGRADDADALYLARIHEEPQDTTIPIGAARAFLEAGDTARAVSWLERAVATADNLGRAGLGARLRATVSALRTRLN